ncbi:hypothetical protein U1Q18_010850 [Sarracenia purpurea var. burkii]
MFGPSLGSFVPFVLRDLCVVASSSVGYFTSVGLAFPFEASCWLWVSSYLSLWPSLPSFALLASCLLVILSSLPLSGYFGGVAVPCWFCSFWAACVPFLVPLSYDLALVSLGGAVLSGLAIGCPIVFGAASVCCLAWEFQGLGVSFLCYKGFSRSFLKLILADGREFFAARLP